MLIFKLLMYAYLTVLLPLYLSFTTMRTYRKLGFPVCLIDIAMLSISIFTAFYTLQILLEEFN